MIVVDASVAIKWFVKEPDFEAAREILGSEEPLCAPIHLIAEVGRWLLRRKRAGDLAAADAKSVLERLPTIVALAPMEPLASLAFDIAGEWSVTIYDAFYVALAQQISGVLVTSDQRLCDSLRSATLIERVQNLRERRAFRDRPQEF